MDDREQVLVDVLAQGVNGCRNYVHVEDLARLLVNIAVGILGFQHDHAPIRGRRHNTAVLIDKGVGNLQRVAAAIVLRWHKSGLAGDGVAGEIGHGDAAEKRRDGIAVVVKKHGRRRLFVLCFQRGADHFVNGQRHHGVGDIGAVGIVVHHGVAAAEIGIRRHIIDRQRLRGQRPCCCVGIIAGCCVAAAASAQQEQRRQKTADDAFVSMRVHGSSSIHVH